MLEKRVSKIVEHAYFMKQQDALTHSKVHLLYEASRSLLSQELNVL